MVGEPDGSTQLVPTPAIVHSSQSVQTTSNLISVRFILMLSSHVLSASFPTGFPTKMLYVFHVWLLSFRIYITSTKTEKQNCVYLLTMNSEVTLTCILYVTKHTMSPAELSNTSYLYIQTQWHPYIQLKHLSYTDELKCFPIL